MVCVELAAFGGTTATYGFEYRQIELTRPDWHSVLTAYAPAKATVQMLDKVRLPDGTGFSFLYIENGFTSPGLPRSMSLPTGGRIDWEWGFYSMVDWSSPALRSLPGITARTVFDRTGATIGSWGYAWSIDGGFWQGAPPPREGRNVITDPLGNR